MLTHGSSWQASGVHANTKILKRNQVRTCVLRLKVAGRESEWIATGLRGTKPPVPSWSAVMCSEFWCFSSEKPCAFENLGKAIATAKMLAVMSVITQILFPLTFCWVSIAGKYKQKFQRRRRKI